MSAIPRPIDDDLPFLDMPWELEEDEDIDGTYERETAQAARIEPITFIEYVLGVNCRPLHDEWQDFLSTHRRAVIFAPNDHGKAMPLDTEIPTATSWKMLGDIQKGDVIYAGDGNPTIVREAHPVLIGQRMYEIEFADGERIRACADHRWLAWSRWDLAERREPRVVTTESLAWSGSKLGGVHYWKIPIAGPVQYPEQSLPVHPYVLGCWLGDGTTDAPSLTCHENDLEIVHRCVALDNGIRGKYVRQDRSPTTVRVNIGGNKDTVRGDNTLRSRLVGLGVLGNKHIPETYLRASVEQRRALLAGLLDTDGSIIRTKGQSRVEFGNTNPALATQTLQLVRSLGFKARMITGTATINGRRIGVVYRVTFTAREPVFNLQRKAILQRNDGDRQRTRHRSIRAVREVDSVPCRCLTVGHPSGTFLAGRDYTVTHNSTEISFGRATWELGVNTNLRIAIGGATSDGPEDSLGLIQQCIAVNKRCQKVFPRLKEERRRGRMRAWGKSQMIVERADLSNKDPSVQAIGIHGSVEGARVDLWILDDILNMLNTMTAGLRELTIKWLKSSVIPRGTADARIWAIGTPWHIKDAMHWLEANGEYVAARYDAEKMYWPFYETIEGKTVGWPEERLRQRERELGPIEYARSMRCQALTDTTRIFSLERFDECVRLHGGGGFEYENQDRYLLKVTGVDLSVKERSGLHETVFFTIGLDRDGIFWVLNITAGNMGIALILKTMIDIEQRYSPEFFVVENVQAQDYIVQFVDRPQEILSIIGVPNAESLLHHIRVEPFTTTGQAKADPQYGICAMPADFEQLKWRIPRNDETMRWRDEQESFTLADHPGDRVMASWFAWQRLRERARRMRIRAQTVGGKTNGQARPEPQAPTIRPVGGRFRIRAR